MQKNHSPFVFSQVFVSDPAVGWDVEECVAGGESFQALRQNSQARHWPLGRLRGAGFIEEKNLTSSTEGPHSPVRPVISGFLAGPRLASAALDKPAECEKAGQQECIRARLRHGHRRARNPQQTSIRSDLASIHREVDLAVASRRGGKVQQEVHIVQSGLTDWVLRCDH